MYSGGHGDIDRAHSSYKSAQEGAALRAHVEFIGGEHHAYAKARENGGDHGRQDVAEVLGVEAAAAAEQRADEKLPEGVPRSSQLFRQALAF